MLLSRSSLFMLLLSPYLIKLVTGEPYFYLHQRPRLLQLIKQAKLAQQANKPAVMAGMNRNPRSGNNSPSSSSSTSDSSSSSSDALAQQRRPPRAGSLASQPMLRPPRPEEGFMSDRMPPAQPRQASTWQLPLSSITGKLHR